LKTASAEDLIVTKAFAGRARDWGDIEGVILCRRGSLNWSLIDSELALLCELLGTRDPVDRLLETRNNLATE
jgi:hypothetical protein